RLLEGDDPAHAGVGAGKDAEDAVADGIDDASLGVGGGLAEQVEMKLVELAADRIAEAGEVRCRGDDVRERHQERALEASPQLVLELVLQTDDLRHAEGA